MKIIAFITCLWVVALKLSAQPAMPPGIYIMKARCAEGEVTGKLMIR